MAIEMQVVLTHFWCLSDDIIPLSISANNVSELLPVLFSLVGCCH